MTTNNTIFQDIFSEEIWNLTYKDHNDNSVDDTFRRVAKAIASVEETEELKTTWEENFYDMLTNFKGVPGGRILSNAGTEWNGTTLMNCFVGPRVKNDVDSLTGILIHLEAQAKTLKSEGGWGENFSYIRPRGAFIHGIGVETPGAVKYMELFDKTSEIITAGSGRKSEERKAKGKIRKGAQMAVLDVWHPDIIEFITAKQQSGRLTKFNVSVNVSDAFMKQLKNVILLEQTLEINKDSPAESVELLKQEIENIDKWDLIFPDTQHAQYKKIWNGDIKLWLEKQLPVKVYNTVSIRWLWNLIMESTYNRAEPGVLFLDRANYFNPLYYGETIFATNPCITGDTLIATADGRNAVSIKQLTEEGKDVPVYSTDTKTGQVQIKMARNPRKTGINKEICKITLDDGSSFKATPNHKVLLRDLTYVEVKDLKAGDSVFPFYSFDSNGYRQVSMVGAKMVGGNHRNRRQYRVISEFYNGIVDAKKYAIHHKNCDSTDDRIENLEIMLHEDHIEFHAAMMRGENNPYHKMTEEWKHNFASHPGIKNGRYSGHTNDQLVEHGKMFVKQNGKFTKKHWVEYARKNKLPLYLDNKFRFGTWDNFKNQISNNHKIVSVEFIGTEDVYNITVDDNHNYHIITSSKDDKFITSSGVCIKNCGEQTLSPGNICCLGTLNLTQFVNQAANGFILPKIKKYVGYMVRFLDNVNTYSTAPLPEYVESMKKKRRIGLGVMGWGSALFMMKIRFASEEANALRDELMSTIAKAAYEASIDLAVEKGKFEFCDPALHAVGPFVEQLKLSPEYMEKLYTTGIRNSSLMSQQPNGTTSIFANITSGGIEPIFMPEYIRTTIVPSIPEDMLDITPKYYEGEWKETKVFKFTKEGADEILKGKFNGVVYKIDKSRGLTREVLCEDYGVRWLKAKGEWDPKAEWAVTTNQITALEHVTDLKGFSKFTDSACSKTINIPNEYPFEDFKNIYLDAYETGYIKGLTTYRAGTMASVLSATDEKTASNADEEIIVEEVKMPAASPALVKILKAEGRKWYLTVVQAENSDRPYALFVHTNSPEKGVTTHDAIERLIALARKKKIKEQYISDLEAKVQNENNVSKITRSLSLLLRHGVLIKNIVYELNKVENVFVGSFLFQITKFLTQYIKDGTKVEDAQCQECGSVNVIFSEGCYKCVNCGSSKC